MFLSPCFPGFPVSLFQPVSNCFRLFPPASNCFQLFSIDSFCLQEYNIYNSLIYMNYKGREQMARQARKVGESKIYHVMLRGINRQEIFEDQKDEDKFLALLDGYKLRCGSWCLPR